jgi:nicotinamidase-related amidase
MHASEIPASVMERVNAVRGGYKPTLVDPAKTAHVVIDLQVGFMDPDALVPVPMAVEIVPQVNRLSQAVREAGALNVFVRFTVDPNEPHHWGPMYDPMPPETLAAFTSLFGAGGAQHQLWPALDVKAEDWIVDKTRFSAFIPGTCDLHERLQARGVDTLIVTGTVTNCCCESTVRDAMQMGYKVLFIQDGNATFDDAAHNATLANMAGLFFADVCSSDEAVARLETGGRKTA